VRFEEGVGDFESGAVDSRSAERRNADSGVADVWTVDSGAAGE